MSERDIQEIDERIRNLREQLAGPLMSAEKEYKIRFEISDLQYESLQKQIGDLKGYQKGQKQANERIKERKQKQANERSEEGKQKHSELVDEGKRIQRRIEKLEMDTQTRVMNQDKERELIDQIHRLKNRLKEIESEKSGKGPLENRDSKPLDPDREINEIQKRIDILQMEQQARVMNTDKEREIIDEIVLLKRKIREIESQKTWNGNSKGTFNK